MKLFADLKARFPRMFPVVTTVLALGTVGGIAAYEKLASDCCYPGSPCCHPGAACCNGHGHRTAQR
jgi:hypothetical protein